MNAYQIAECDVEEMLLEIAMLRDGISTKKLADLSGVKPRVIQDCLNGKKLPSLSRYVALSNALGQYLAPAPVLVQSLRLKRSRAGITRKALAEASGIGLTSLQAYENGKALPGLFNYVRWRNALDTLTRGV